MAKGKVLEKDLLATMLVEAMFSTDEQACAKYGVSLRSLQRARQQLASDPELAGLVATKKAALDAQWAESLSPALRQAVETVSGMTRAMLEDPQMRKNPIALEKVAGAMKLLADVYYTGKLVDARLADPNRPADGVPRQGDAEDFSDSAYSN